MEAFTRIYKAGLAGKALFISRGDNSGTHERELLLWRMAGLNPAGERWYLESGAGMAHTLTLANEKKAYTLTDVGTWLKLRERLRNLKPLVGEDKLLLNIYSIYLVDNPTVDSQRVEEASKLFLNFVVSREGQEVIAELSPMFNPVGSRLSMLREAWEMFAGL